MVTRAALEIGAWSFFGIWCLGFGICPAGLNRRWAVLAFFMSWPRREKVAMAQGNSALLILNQKAVPTTVEKPTIEKETKSEDELDLPWQVVVHNDPVNLMTYVTMVFQRVFGYPREKAERHMLEVHHKGRSILWSGLRERAELYVQQLHGYLLLATLEKVS
jgi:ATP-dependent Clp protease adaptor protein ClpS